ncbi:hypothetical protein ACFU8W_50705 [Streptomyces sp. NPDC057565]|uniref:hypothetical protein n=1 Tax=Streptomyces sp. NPDC057565 TaxID=3346169 RepID=UPI0036B4FA9E
MRGRSQTTESAKTQPLGRVPVEGSSTAPIRAPCRSAISVRQKVTGCAIRPDGSLLYARTAAARAPVDDDVVYESSTRSVYDALVPSAWWTVPVPPCAP